MNDTLRELMGEREILRRMALEEALAVRAINDAVGDGGVDGFTGPTIRDHAIQRRIALKHRIAYLDRLLEGVDEAEKQGA
jgi:hypothetical protein